MYDRILVPTDGSEYSEKAAEHAIEFAKKFDAELHVLYVIDTRVFGSEDYWQSMKENFEEKGEELAEEIADMAREEDIGVTAGIDMGVPHKTINSYVDENSIDLIVMGTHGRTGAKRLLLGSVTEKTVRSANVPVVTVNRKRE